MRIPFDTAIWPIDAPAATLRLNALLEGHEMGPWAIVDTPPYDIPQSSCAGCGFNILATDAGDVCYSSGIWYGEPGAYELSLTYVPPCDDPLPVGEDVRLRLLGQPELFEEARI